MKRLLHSSLHLKNLAIGLILVLTASALYLTTDYLPLQADMTRNSSNSLSQGSVDLIGKLQGLIKVTMYASSKDADLGDIEQFIRDFISLYQRHKKDITLEFVDPAKNAEAARQAEIRTTRELVVEYNGRNEHLTLVNEQSFSSALLRLAHAKDQTLFFLDGHGERKLDGVANHDLGDFGNKLKRNGFRIASLKLAIAQDVPTNSSVLIITQPQINLLPGEVDKILRYVDNGGNLLWLLDAEPMRGLERLASKLGILLTPGIITDPDAQQMNAPENWTLGASYPPHPVTANFNLLTAFPFARALGRDDSNSQGDNSSASRGTRWQYSTLIEAASNGWVSRSSTIPHKPRYDSNRDIRGPFSLAIALQRNIHEREQRIIVVGSGAFLANAYAGNGGNLDLGISILNWLAHEDHLITIQPRNTLDNVITLSKNQLGAISIGFVIIVPLLLLSAGVAVWWRRRV